MTATSFPSRMTVNWTVSPGLYSPIKLDNEPAAPTLTPLTAVTISLSLRPALLAGLSLTMAEYDEELYR